MSDHATPNLPARDFDETCSFYEGVGFAPTYRSGQWMILERGGLKLEFFPFPELDPRDNAFGSCLRLDDLDSFYAVCAGAGIGGDQGGIPRLVPPRVEPWGGRVGFLVDPNGTLLRLVQN